MMDFYLTNERDPSDEMRLPINPETLNLEFGSKTQGYSVIEMGDIEIPRGLVPTKITFDYWFPGLARAGLPIIKGLLQDPEELVQLLQTWRVWRVPLLFRVTGTRISERVFVKSFGTRHQGGHGDVRGSIELVELRMLAVLTVGEAETQAVAASQTTTAPAPGDAPRPDPVGTGPGAYTVMPGDTLWGIAQAQLDDGSRWGEVWDANRGTIGDTPDVLEVGWEITIP